MRNFALLILLLLTATAAAEPNDHRFALSINSPLFWKDGSVGASGYVGLSDHHALRLNVATWDIHTLPIRGDGLHFGRLVDVSAGWMYFPMRRFDGLTFELGLMRRSGATYENSIEMTPEIVDRDTQLYAARALLGWSWLIHDRVMISVAAGASRGYEVGIETTTRDSVSDQMPDTHEVSRWTTTAEGYFRVGFTFGR